MINLVISFLLILAIIWIAKKFYFPTTVAQYPERFNVIYDKKSSKKEIGIVLSNLQRWKDEGKLSREEYDHITDICLSEMQAKQPDSE